MRRMLFIGGFLCLASLALADSGVLELRSQAREAMRAGNYEVAARAYERLAHENPSDGSLWEALGLAQLRLADYEAAIESIRRSIATGLRPASGYYNIACALNLAGQADAAIDALAQAYALGFADEHLLRSDADLASLHENVEFRRLVGWPDPTVESRSERWRQDIEFLDRRLHEVHWNLFGQCRQPEYERAKQHILSRIDALDDDQLEWEIRCWLAGIGDGHTALSIDEFLARHLGPHASVELLPLQFFEYEDGVRVKMATTELAALAGCRVLGFGDASIDSVLGWVTRGVSKDNQSGARWMRSVVLSDPRALRGLGLAGNSGSIRMRYETTAGNEAMIELKGGGAELLSQRKPFWQLQEQPLSMSQLDSQQPFYVKADSGHDMLYVRLDAVHDGPSETLAEFALRTTAMRRELQLGHLVLDLRNNHGGQGELVRPFLHELIRDPAFETPGALYVLIGRETFSAAMAFAAQIEINTKARFVGEPSGSRPNFVGETTLVQLPYCQRWVSISSRYHQNGYTNDSRQWIPPIISAAPNFAMERAGRDLALEAIQLEIGGAH